MLTATDHLILAVTDPDAAAAELEQRLGLTATGGGRHEAHGTFNRLFWLGDSYIELMGVFDQSLAAGSWWGAHMARLLDSAPAAYAGMALTSDDLDSDLARLRAQGAAILDPSAGERVRPDGDVVRWRIGRLSELDPELGLAFLIEHDISSAEWRPAERDARAVQLHQLGTTGRLARVELPVPDVGATTLRLLRRLGLQFRPSLAGRGARDTTIGTQLLRVVPSAAGGVPLITIRAGRERQEAELLGCRWLLEPA